MFIVREFSDEQFILPKDVDLGMYRHRFSFDADTEVNPAANAKGTPPNFSRQGAYAPHRYVGLLLGMPVILGEGRFIEHPAIDIEINQNGLKTAIEQKIELKDPLFLVTIASLGRTGVRYTLPFFIAATDLLKKTAEANQSALITLLGEIENDNSRSLAYAKRVGFQEVMKTKSKTFFVMTR